MGDEMSKGMEERKNAAIIKVSDSDREKILRKFRSQMKLWKLIMPPHEPLVSDFGLDDFYKTGLIEYWIANEIEAGYCAKFLFVFRGQTCPLHWHKGKHETFFLLRGKVRLLFNGEERELQAGECLTVPSKTPHSFTGISPSLLLEVSQPCLVKDNVFHDPHIPIGLNYNSHLRRSRSRFLKVD
jgi:mannose-6-phosphate isomerase-like protein (cupin superfamily)